MFLCTCSTYVRQNIRFNMGVGKGTVGGGMGNALLTGLTYIFGVVEVAIDGRSGSQGSLD